jgi:hypothetical protein
LAIHYTHALSHLLQAVIGRVARLAYANRGGTSISAIPAGKAAFDAAAAAGATALQQAYAAGTEAGKVVSTVFTVLPLPLY